MKHHMQIWRPRMEYYIRHIRRLRNLQASLFWRDGSWRVVIGLTKKQMNFIDRQMDRWIEFC